MTHGRKFDYAYDGRGNQTYRYLSADQSKYWHYSWNGENRMTQAQLVDGATTLRTVTFKYDPFGRRVQKQVSGLAPQVPVPVTTNYVYDGEDIVLQTESDGTTTTTVQYVHGPGIDEPLAMVRGGQSYYYHADGLGSIVAISDSALNVVARYGYDAFGMVTASDPGFDNVYTYTGREWDKELGLYYYRARYYDPMEGRFISKDPIGFAGGDVNLYGYVQNNSVNYFDPYGLWELYAGAGFGANNNESEHIPKGNFSYAVDMVLRDKDGNWFSGKTTETFSEVDKNRCKNDNGMGAGAGLELGFTTGELEGTGTSKTYQFLWVFSFISTKDSNGNWGAAISFGGPGAGYGVFSSKTSTKEYDSITDMPGIKNIH